MIPSKGDRVRMIGIMPDDPCPMEVGAEGTVRSIGDVIAGRRQIDIDWDNGRGLILLDTDPFRIVQTAEERKAWEQAARFAEENRQPPVE